MWHKNVLANNKYSLRKIEFELQHSYKFHLSFPMCIEFQKKNAVFVTIFIYCHLRLTQLLAAPLAPSPTAAAVAATVTAASAAGGGSRPRLPALTTENIKIRKNLNGFCPPTDVVLNFEVSNYAFGIKIIMPDSGVNTPVLGRARQKP